MCLFRTSLQIQNHHKEWDSYIVAVIVIWKDECGFEVIITWGESAEGFNFHLDTQN